MVRFSECTSIIKNPQIREFTIHIDYIDLDSMKLQLF
jgi:hypothetical protein